MNLNFLNVLAYLESKPGKTLDEIAAHFEASPRTVQRWIADIKRDLPKIELHEMLENSGRKRIRIAKPLRLQAKSIGRHDMLTLHSLRLAIRLLNALGFHDDRLALEAIEELLLKSTPCSTRKLLDQQLGGLAEIEQLPLLAVGRFCQTGIAATLRYIAVTERLAEVRLGCGRLIEGQVIGIIHGANAAVRLKTAQGEEQVDLADIAEVGGGEDMWCDYARAA